MSEKHISNLVASNIARSGDLSGYYDALDELEKQNQNLASFTAGLDGDTRNRWPTLFEIVNGKTVAPLDFWSFYQFMRDDQRAINYLDFWIDTVQHLNLCKIYVRGLRTSLARTSHYRGAEMINEYIAQSQDDLKVNAQGADVTLPNVPQHHNRDSHASSRDSRSSSMLLDLLMRNSLLENSDPHRLSTFLRGEAAVRSSDPAVNAKIDEIKRRSMVANGSGSSAGGAPLEYSDPNVRISMINPDMVEALIDHEAQRSMDPSVNVRHGHITRRILRESSQTIMAKYFSKESERYIQFTPEIINKVHDALELNGRDDPEVFDEAREFVFKVMEYDAYPTFLIKYALRNVTDRSAFFRLFASAACAFAGFWVGYYLIFYDDGPAHLRGVVTLPFFFMAYFFFSAFYHVDPLLSAFGFTENHLSFFHPIKIEDGYCKGLLRKRALFVLLFACLVAAALSVLFGLVPGHRLSH
ncbi:Rax1 protein [Martiniozyma asiatica (nom. inval.)]|nr:Rax1 protein [Martiniozyma asiatica]